MPLEQRATEQIKEKITNLEQRQPLLQRPRRAFPLWNCIGAVLATLVLLELLARFMVSVGGPHMGPTLEFDRSYALAVQPCAPGKQLIVCIGGSFAKRALFSELIEGKLKKAGFNVEVRNLATVACSSEEQLALLKAANDKAKRPILVVSDLRPLAFEKNYLDKTIGYEKLRFVESYIGQRTEYGARHDLLSRITDLVERNLYLFGYRPYLRYTLINWMPLVFNSEQIRIQRMARADFQVGQSRHGWGPVFEIMEEQHMVPGDKQFEEIVQSVKDLIGLPPFKWSFEYTQAIAGFCAENHLPLLYVWEPVHGSMSEIYTRAGVPLSQFQSLFSQIPSRLLNTYYLDLHDSDGDSSHFKNIDHVNAQGAAAFSDKLADRLLQPPFVELLAKQKHNSSETRSAADNR